MSESFLVPLVRWSCGEIMSSFNGSFVFLASVDLQPILHTVQVLCCSGTINRVYTTILSPLTSQQFYQNTSVNTLNEFLTCLIINFVRRSLRWL